MRAHLHDVISCWSKVLCNQPRVRSGIKPQSYSYRPNMWCAVFWGLSLTSWRQEVSIFGREVDVKNLK
jgi:hypothetical protein